MNDIIVNGSVLDERPTGIGIYTNQILEEFKKRDLIFTCFSSMSQKDTKCISITNLVRPYPYKKIGGILRFFINQTYFTVVAKNFDIAYLPTPHGSIFLKNQIITIHDLLALHYPDQHKLQYYYYKYFMPIILRKAKKIIAISESTKNDLITFYNLESERITVVHNGFDSNINFKENAKEYILEKYSLKKYVFTVGSSYPHKNLENLIEAFIQLKHINLKLAITGIKGDYQQKIISKYNTDNIIFLGYVEYADLSYLYSAAEIMVYPSLYEGFGFPPLEAMNCRCPVIVSNTSSLPEVCGDAVEYIEPKDIDSISSAMKKILKDDLYKQELIRKGITQVKKFNWEKTTNQILAIIKDSSNV